MVSLSYRQWRGLFRPHASCPRKRYPMVHHDLHRDGFPPANESTHAMPTHLAFWGAVGGSNCCIPCTQKLFFVEKLTCAKRDPVADSISLFTAASTSAGMGIPADVPRLLPLLPEAAVDFARLLPSALPLPRPLPPPPSSPALSLVSFSSDSMPSSWRMSESEKTVRRRPKR